MIHYYLTNTYNTLEFTTIAGMDKFTKNQNHIKLEDVRKCSKSQNYRSGVFQCLNQDKKKPQEERLNHCNNSILFVRAALKAYNGQEYSCDRHLLPKYQSNFMNKLWISSDLIFCDELVTRKFLLIRRKR